MLRRTRSQQIQQARLSYHLSIQVVFSQRDNNSIESCISSHIAFTNCSFSAIASYSLSVSASDTSTATQAFQRIYCFYISHRRYQTKLPALDQNKTVFSTTHNKLHSLSPHAAISHRTQQHEAIQFSILPNWISFPRTHHANFSSRKDSEASRKAKQSDATQL